MKRATHLRSVSLFLILFLSQGLSGEIAEAMQPARVRAITTTETAPSLLSPLDEIRDTTRLLARLEKIRDPDPTTSKIKQIFATYLSLLKIVSTSANTGATNEGTIFPLLGRISSLSPEFKSNLLGALKNRDLLFPNPVSDLTVFNVIHYVQMHRPGWNSGLIAEPLFVRAIDGQEVAVLIKRDQMGRVYLHTHSPPAGEGATKEVHGVMLYDEWKRLARLGLKLESKRSHFEHEQEILKLISALPAASRTHLVDTFYQEGDQIFQTYYSRNLLQFMKDELNYPKMRFHEKLEWVRQIAQAISVLHQMGIFHGDLKEENILVREEAGHAPDLVVSDFDISYFPEFLITTPSAPHPNRPTSGSLPFIAPEVLKSPRDGDGWIGYTVSEKVEIALRADVFALGTIAYDIAFAGKKNWYHPCIGIAKSKAKTKYSDFYECQKKELIAFSKAIRANDRRSSLEELILTAIQPDPRLRISSAQFLSEIESILAR